MTTPHDVHAAIRRHYLSLPGRTEEDWRNVVMQDHTKFNQVWRHMLHKRCKMPYLEINTLPPPKDLRATIPESFDDLRS